MADAPVEHRRPSIRAGRRPRRRARPWLLLPAALASTLCLVAMISYSWVSVPALLLGLAVPVSRVWWLARPGPGEVRGELLVPPTPWWKDRRAVATFDASGVRIRRAFDPEGWDVPWAAIDEVLVEEGRPCLLSLMLDGAPLARITAGRNSASLVARLRVACPTSGDQSLGAGTAS